jgi:hypothetical protein
VNESSEARPRDGEVERALQHDQDEPECPDHRDDGIDPVEVDADGAEDKAHDDARGDQQHDGGQAVPPAQDVEQVGEERQRGRRQDGRIGHRSMRASARESAT